MVSSLVGTRGAIRWIRIPGERYKERERKRNTSLLYMEKTLNWVK